MISMAMIVDRLKDATPALVSVEMAEDLDAIFKGTAPANGSVFVVPFREKGSPNRVSMGGFQQRVSLQFLTAFVIRKHDDPKGGIRAAMFDQVKGTIRTALAGWEPTEDSDPVELVAAEGTPLPNNVTLYVITWETTELLTGA